MLKDDYQPEAYWSAVGKRIAARAQSHNVIAGDDEPYYRYKRREFLKLLREVNFTGRSVLELGCGPGGNLIEVLKLAPRQLTAVDISAQMISLARQKVPAMVELIKIDDSTLPFADQTFEVVFTATVLQHNTDENMLRQIMAELCRVSVQQVILFERIEQTIQGDALCVGRPLPYYAEIMAAHGFELTEQKFINVRVSYYVCGAIRKLLNPLNRQEGEPLNKISEWLQTFTLFFTRPLDKIFTSTKDIARLIFVRNYEL